MKNIDSSVGFWYLAGGKREDIGETALLREDRGEEGASMEGFNNRMRKSNVKAIPQWPERSPFAQGMSYQIEDLEIGHYCKRRTEIFVELRIN